MGVWVQCRVQWMHDQSVYVYNNNIIYFILYLGCTAGCTGWVALHGLQCIGCTGWVALHVLQCMGSNWLHCMSCTA